MQQTSSRVGLLTLALGVVDGVPEPSETVYNVLGLFASEYLSGKKVCSCHPFPKGVCNTPPPTKEG